MTLCSMLRKWLIGRGSGGGHVEVEVGRVGFGEGFVPSSHPAYSSASSSYRPKFLSTSEVQQNRLSGKERLHCSPWD